MLHRRLTLLTVAATTIALIGCSDGGAIEEDVVRPGITAADDEAPAATCAANASTLRIAVDAYTALEGEPPPDEPALVDAGFLREATSDWDVVDGELVAEDPACDAAAGDEPVATLDIVTDAEPLDPDEVYAELDQAAIDSIGGEACARELAGIIAAGENFTAERSAEPADIAELVDTGYLAATPQLWQLVDDELVPTATGGCNPLS